MRSQPRDHYARCEQHGIALVQADDGLCCLACRLQPKSCAVLPSDTCSDVNESMRRAVLAYEAERAKAREVFGSRTGRKREQRPALNDLRTFFPAEETTTEEGGEE